MAANGSRGLQGARPWPVSWLVRLLFAGRRQAKRVLTTKKQKQKKSKFYSPNLVAETRSRRLLFCRTPGASPLAVRAASDRRDALPAPLLAASAASRRRDALPAPPLAAAPNASPRPARCLVGRFQGATAQCRPEAPLERTCRCRGRRIFRIFFPCLSVRRFGCASCDAHLQNFQVSDEDSMEPLSPGSSSDTGLCSATSG